MLNPFKKASTTDTTSVAPSTTPTQKTSFKEYLTGTVTKKHVFIMGIILGIFHPPVIGFVFALCLAFKKETRRLALYIALWTIVWMVLYGFILGFILAWMGSGAV